MWVRITSMSADLKMAELGHGAGDDAVRSFLGFPWEEAMETMKQLEIANARLVVSPDMTFTALPAHLIARAEDARRFNVEVCLPRLKKLFGLFSLAKFYTFKDVSTEEVCQMLQQFCADDLGQKHRYFALDRQQGT